MGAQDLVEASANQEDLDRGEDSKEEANKDNKVVEEPHTHLVSGEGEDQVEWDFNFESNK